MSRVSALLSVLVQPSTTLTSHPSPAWQARFPSLFEHHQGLCQRREREKRIRDDSAGEGEGEGEGELPCPGPANAVDASATLQVLALALRHMGAALTAASAPADRATLAAHHYRLFSYCTSHRQRQRQRQGQGQGQGQGGGAVITLDAVQLYHRYNHEHLSCSPHLALPWEVVRSLVEYLPAQHPPGAGSRFAGESMVCTLVRHQCPRGHL